MNMEGKDYTVVFRSPDTKNVFAYSPSVLSFQGRILVSMDAGGPGVKDLEGGMKDGEVQNGRIYISDDGGKSFRFIKTFPFEHARLFDDGDRVYIIGQLKDLKIIASDDGGETWSEPSVLTEDGAYHGAPTNVIRHNGYIYMAFENDMHRDVTTWNVSALSPVVLKAKEGSDLTKRENWIFSQQMSFRNAVPAKDLDYFGVPFYSTPEKASAPCGRVRCAPPGWLETNVVKIYDKEHYLYDESAVYLFMRAHTGGTGYCAMMKARETITGGLTLEYVYAPSGKKWVYCPMPGGQMKFHILYDEETKTYWLLSTQATDSMRRAEYLPDDRFNLPNNERHRLQLHFSYNMIDWCFACMVDAGEGQRQSRHYAAMDFDGDDIVIASRSGDELCLDAHDTNLITFHRVKDFRKFIY